MQLCLVHLVRHSLTYVSWKQRKAVAVDLRAIYIAATADEAAVALDAFAQKWSSVYPQIAKSRRNHWAHVIAFFAYAPEICKVIYTTNAIESVNSHRRGRDQALVFGATQYQPTMDDANSELETSLASAYEAIRGTIQQRLTNSKNTKS